ncbi:MAG: hypothetical protein WCF07_06925 [Nitrososphaeraceae archaeon]
MNQTFLITLTLTLSLGVMTFVSAGLGHSYGQQNQTSNTTSTQPQQGQQQQNQTTEIGSANEIENLTAGNIPVLGNETNIESQNDTSVGEGLQKEQSTSDTNMTDNQTEAGGNQTQKSPLEQIGETISGIFGGANQSK